MEAAVEVKFGLLVLLLSWLAAAQAAGPSASACAQASGLVNQRMSQAINEKDFVDAAAARRALGRIVTRCQAAQQRQQLRNRQELRLRQQHEARRHLAERWRLHQLQQRLDNQRRATGMRR